MSNLSVSSGPDWVHLDTADTFSVDGSDSDISTFSPWSSPWVSDDVVLGSVFNSVSNSDDSVIEVGSAFWVVEDTTRVELEDHLVGFNGDWDWTLSDGSHKLINWVGLDGSEVGDLDFSLWWVIFAGSVNTGVWVDWFEFHSVLFSILESSRHFSTIATGITEWAWAINELLFRETQEFSGGDLMVTFHGSNSWESPAWSAWTLILWCIDGSLFSPINGGWDVWGVKNGDFSILEEHWWWFVSEEFLVFCWGVVSEFVKTNGVGVSVLGILLWDGWHGGLELGVSEFIFLFGSVGFSVLW
jgi:hypothetical protein